MTSLARGLAAALMLTALPALAEKVSFTTPDKACRLKVRNRRKKQSRFADFRKKLTPGLEARGLANAKGLVMFAVNDAKWKDALFVGSAKCLLGSGGASGGSADVGDEPLDGLHKGLYAKSSLLYFTESLVFDAAEAEGATTASPNETLKATNLGAMIGLGYDFGGSSLATSIEVMPLFAMSTIKNTGTINALVYEGKGLVLGAIVNLVAHYHFTNAFGAGLYLPVGLRFQTFPSRPEGKVKEPSLRPLYGGGLSLRFDLGGFRLGAQAGSLYFKSDFMVGLNGELEL